MGHGYVAKCKKCGFEFRVDEGGGFFFHMLRCSICGKEKSINFDEIGEPHLQYIKRLSVPYCVVSGGQDKNIQDNYPGDPITEEEYNSIVEKITGKCKCGGQYKFDAPPRCPKCKSTEMEDTGEIKICYD